MDNQLLDVDALRLPEKMTAEFASPKARPPRHKPGEKFIKGPVPWTWVRRAAQFKGRALAVGMLIWRQAGIAGANPVKLCLGWAAELGINPQAARRGLAVLENARLVSVERPKGCCSIVTILPVDGSENAHGSENKAEKTADQP
jgi:hypothetical protein